MKNVHFHSILDISSEFLATGILPTLSLECDYIFRFPEVAQKHVLCKDLLLFLIFTLLEAAMERGQTPQTPLGVARQSVLSKGFGQATN